MDSYKEEFKMVEWDFAESPVNEEQIQQVETKLGIKFPKDYKECVMQNGGGTPTPEVFDAGERKDAVFGYLYSFHEDSDSFIINAYNRYRDGRMADRLIPIADDAFGNEICFDFRASETNPPVVFWDHEEAFENPEAAVTYVCDNFTELINSLREYEEEE
ncbi:MULTISPECIES: SMI1/KNR4 family protein [Bacillus]|uniref:SMI1/KNR4 family protein n=1 Tax=Bacillus TaxID=1386 RepID=UPI0022800781|nr:SMI1/KNR4 family protein [Bacillus haynesii]MEC1458119.1 SMI1/KNR4 family protein [Bacillus haynesii]MEC1575438.1 SMI1/KNR4 family protein [Bacillus haynesii]